MPPRISSGHSPPFTSPTSEPNAPAHTIDRTPEYEEFIENARAFYKERGTKFEAEPRVTTVHIDLLKVYNHVVKNGGYDVLSGEKLLWRRMAKELGIVSSNDGQTAFQLKEKYYYNLVAFEIKSFWGEEPPSVDLVEKQSAAKGNVRGRTWENFLGKQDPSLTADPSSAFSGDDTTPSRERASADTPDSHSRASRRLRKDPPQRVIFQPDSGPVRGRNMSNPPKAFQATATPVFTPQKTHLPVATNPPLQPPLIHAHHHLPHALPPPAPAPQTLPRGRASITHKPQSADHLSSIVDSYETKLSLPIHVRSVNTPTNNPAEFARRRQPGRPPPDPIRSILAPHLEGPNMYIRFLMALRSKIPDEQAFALYHLVRISYERGDRFKFDAFSGLLEALVEKGLEVGRLFYEVDWKISWIRSEDTHVDTIYGNEISLDILERIDTLRMKLDTDLVQSREFSETLALVNDAILTIRNMVTLHENALYAAKFYPLRDLFCIILYLPDRESVIEPKHSVLDITEQIAPYITLDPDDPLYKMLLKQLDSDDRGTILTALRALARLSTGLEAGTRLEDVPRKVLVKISEWLFLNDDEMLDACLDFLYQYTSNITNVDHLIRSVVPEHLVAHLVRLLSHGARKFQQEIVLRPEQRAAGSEEIAPIPAELVQELVKMDGVRRVNHWVKCFFEVDPDSFVTQLAVWQAYQGAFSMALKSAGIPPIQPSDFIRTSVKVYPDSEVKVLKEGDNVEAQKYLIKGIRPRVRPLSVDGREYQQCYWCIDSSSAGTLPCNQLFSKPKSLYSHVMEAHLRLQKGPNGYINDRGMHALCRWQGCWKHARSHRLDLPSLSKHVTIHITNLWPSGPGKDIGGGGDTVKSPKKTWLTPAKTMSLPAEETATTRDERNPNASVQAAGIPLSAVLVLRNIAKNVGQTDAEEGQLKASGEEGKAVGWNERLFKTLIPRLFDIQATNAVLAPNVASLIELVYQDPELA